MSNISVNNISLPDAALEQAALQLGEGATPEAIARAAAVRELLRQHAVEKGLLESGEDEDAAIEKLLDQEVKIPEWPTENECRRFYENNPDAFRSGELVYARHILFAVTPGAPLEMIRSKAEQTLHELLHEPERFAQYAREYSNCPSGAQEGNLGQLTRGETVPEFEVELFGNNAHGILPRLVRTRFGFHILAVDKRIEGNRVPFDEVRESIENCLLEHVRNKALSQYVQLLAGQADIRGIDLNGSATPLVQ